MRSAYKVRAYPDPEQAAVLNRTFGCVRVVWNRTLATRQARYATEHTSTSYKDTDAALTALKKTPEYQWLNEVSSVPLQQTLRHQHTAFQAFFGKRAYPLLPLRWLPVPEVSALVEMSFRGPILRSLFERSAG